MDAILMSIQPKWVKGILNGNKTEEIRKTRPNQDAPFTVYIYCTKPKRIYHSIRNKYAWDFGEGVCFDYSSEERKICSYPGRKRGSIGKEGTVFAGKKDLCMSVVGQFTCNHINHYRAEFVDDDCYEDIRLIEWNKDDQEEEEFIITSNEKDDPSACALCENSCLSYDQIKDYIFNGQSGFFDFYGWEISDLVIYDEPRPLGIYLKKCTDKYNYCQCCDHGYIKYPEWAETSDDCMFFEEICTNFFKHPPQSWSYCQNRDYNALFKTYQKEKRLEDYFNKR